jgi:OOP family OmpA-OmpF porin
MTDSSDQDNGGKVPSGKFPTDDDSLKNLRRLLLGPYQDQLSQLQDRLDTPELHAHDVSKILPEAIVLRSSRDKKIELALEPITEKAIRASIQKDRQVLVDALFPVMGPAIRKAIASALQGMIQSFNQILEHSLSFKGLKWRFEALRTRKPFAEVVLLHTLVYQVEQVFLIHKDTGLVLQHVVVKSVVAQDPDLVSGMLSAIKDFVQDSFGDAGKDALETVRVGERNVWIEQGDRAILAAIIRGNPPMDLQLTLREALEEIHFKQRDALEAFDGDATSFEEIHYILDNCLQAQFKEQQRKRSYSVWFVLAIILILLGAWTYHIYDGQRQWKRYIDRLHREPGIVVTRVDKKSGHQYIAGLRDPLAADPVKLLQNAGLSAENVIFAWEPYYSTYPDYANRRISDIFKPPDSITLEFSDGLLSAKGSALNRWLVEARKLVTILSWVEEFQSHDIVNIDKALDPPETVILEISGTTLAASGSASHDWIQLARSSIGSLPGISRFQDHELIDTDLVTLKGVKQKLEKRIIFFKAGLNEPLSGQDIIITGTVADINRLISLSKILNQQLSIELTGHADKSGTEDENLRLSLERAEALRRILVLRGVSAKLTTTGAGSRSLLKEGMNSQDQTYNRQVTLRVHLIEKTQ